MDLLKKYTPLLLIGAALLAALVFFVLNVPKKQHANRFEQGVMSCIAPLMKPVSFVTRTGGGWWSNYLDLVDVRRENLRLREDLKQQNRRIVESEEALLENRRLEKLLDMKSTIRRTTLTASIIGDDVTPWFHTLTIDRGASSGLSEGMAVVAAAGVVGQIVKVAPATARVLLLTDHTSGIAATILRSRARGVVKGKGEGLCSLEFASREEDVKVGDVVMTSGIGGVFPKGVPVGEVTMVKRGEYGVFQTVVIRPAVSVSHLEEVLVVTGNAND